MAIKNKRRVVLGHQQTLNSRHKKTFHLVPSPQQYFQIIFMDSKNTINTEFDFILPRGLVDAEGNIHRQGVMRLATAKDEIYLQKNRAALDNSAYGVIVMLSRVIVRLGNLSEITTDLLENLFSRDLAYLREFYNRINQQGDAYIPVQCPQCNGQFQVELALAGEL